VYLLLRPAPRHIIFLIRALQPVELVQLPDVLLAEKHRIARQLIPRL
jgi:hypothetical protein